MVLPLLSMSYTTLIVSCSTALAQSLRRSDAGTLQESQRQIPLLLQPSAPPVKLPQVKPPVPGPSALRITPVAFRFEGNSVFG